MTAKEEVLYVLELAEGRYYVGRTRKPAEDRFHEHLLGKGSEWTRKYPPKRVMYVKRYKRFLERNTTFEMMDRYGIDNVRGAEWCSMVLSSQERYHIQNGIDAENGKCYVCGGVGHYARDCVHSAKNLVDDYV